MHRFTNPENINTALENKKFAKHFDALQMHIERNEESYDESVTIDK
jgi:hypothetical protein